MTEIIDCIGRFVDAVGWPVAFGVFACILFWKALTWLDKQWDKRETRISDLTTRVDGLANGQRRALEEIASKATEALMESTRSKDETNAVLVKVASAMDSWTRVIQHCKEQTMLTEDELDEKALARIERRRRRTEETGGG